MLQVLLVRRFSLAARLLGCAHASVADGPDALR